MLRTALLCLALVWGALAGANWLTHDFQAWTAEDARRLDVALRPVATPAATIERLDLPQQDLRALLANGRDVTVVDFIYTRCITICLSLGSTFQQMQAALQQQPLPAGSGQVKLLSVSFDARDTPQDLHAYAGRLRADPALWRFVRIADVSQRQRLLRAFEVVVVPDGRGDFEHNAALLVVDADGQLVRIFDIAEQQLALDYARHLAEGGSL